MFERTQNIFGRTWGTYLQALVTTAQSLYEESGELPSVRQIWRHTLAKALSAQASPGDVGSHDGKPWIMYDDRLRWGGASIPWLAMNPCGMKATGFTKAHGAFPNTYKGFAIFPSAAVGYAAAVARLTTTEAQWRINYPERYRGKAYPELTIAQAIDAWRRRRTAIRQRRSTYRA